MTNAESGLATTQKALARVEHILFGLMSRRDEMHPVMFAIEAEGAVDTIHELRAQIDEYIGLMAAEAAVAALNVNAPWLPPAAGDARPAEPVAKAS